VRQIPISEFRQQCLSLVDDLPPEGIVITRRGQPIAKVVPVKRSPSDLIGSIPDLIVDKNDDLFTTGIRWEAGWDVES
jgi:antitoxin (DNA-binding transcriptional repressor) of toxin-antitoxin stability system